METKMTWKGKMLFEAEAGSFKVLMDTKAPLGADSAPSPKQLVLAAICGCSAMDIAGLLKKFRTEPDTFEIFADAPTKETHPATFTEVKLTYKFTGSSDPEKLKEAVFLSQTKYCSVSAMISKAVPITYKIELNGTQIGEGRAHFQTT